MRPASRDAGKGDAAAASDSRAGDDGGAAAADDCDADADGSFAATVAAEDGGGADAEDGGGATSRTTATDEPGAAGSSRLDVEQTIGLLLELNVNSARKSKAAAKVTAPTVTTDVIAAAVAAAAAADEREGRTGLRSAGPGAVEDPAEAPNELAGLRGVSKATRDTRCRCVSCGYTCAFGLQLGRAKTFECRESSMWGASSFEGHPVANMIMIAATLLEEHGWRELKIPYCDRDFLDGALRGSSARAEAAALHAWEQAALDRTARAATASAVELPFVEPAPCMPVRLADGSVEHVVGVPLGFVCVDRKHVLDASAALRELWGHELTPEVVKGYAPLSLSEETVLRVVASATIHGDHCAPTAIGERQAAQWMERDGLAVAVCQMDSATLASVRAAARRAAVGAGTAHEVALMRASLRTSAVSHILAPCGGWLDRPAEEVARSSEAAAFQLDPGDVADQLFCRPGAAAGMFNAASAAERLARHPDVQARARRRWPEHITFLAPSETRKGIKSVAMRYISDAHGRARKRKSGVGSNAAGSSSMAGDGPNQPRYVRVYPPLRGVELDGDALQHLSADEAYMTRVRVPQQDVAGRILLTMLHHGYGLQALSPGQPTNPFKTSAVTWLRVCSESESFRAACGYYASGTRASVVVQPLAMHVDGVAQRRQRRGAAVELLTTRWAEAARGWTDSQRAAELAAARHAQPLVASSVWLRTSIALDVRPCRGLALVAVRHM